MDRPLLTTKLYVPPPRPGYVPRPRLARRLDAGLAGKLTLVSAPPGFGKSTLVSAWVHERERRAAWLSLDGNDNDVTTFLTYLVAALQRIRPEAAAAASALLAPGSHGPAESVLTAFINAAAPHDDACTLVLDDCHTIQEPGIHRAIAFLLDHLPPTLHLVLVTRSDPPLALIRLRVRGLLNELRADDLRFTADEAGSFLRDVMGIGVSSEELAHLETRTEGWIAGLQLAGLALQGRTDRAAFVKDFAGSHRFVGDYLSEEVLGRQPPDVQSFLLQTSVLQRLTAPLCDAVTGRTDSHTMLEALHRANLFLIPLDEVQGWFRYHHLFADLLQHRLRNAQGALLPELHHRASCWFETHGFVEEALDHALAGGDVARAATLIEEAAPGNLARGELAMLAGWLDRLPAEVIRTRAPLSVYAAWVSNLTGGAPEATELLLRDAEQTLDHCDGGTVSQRELRGHIATIRAYDAHRCADVSRFETLLVEARARLPEREAFLRSNVEMNLAASYRYGCRLDEALEVGRSARVLARHAGNRYAEYVATFGEAEVLHMQGRLRDAAAICRRTIAEARERSGGPLLPPVAYTLLCLGHIHYEWDDLDEAATCLEEGLDLGRENFRIVLYGYPMLAWLRHQEGRRGEAAALMEEARRVAERARTRAWFMLFETRQTRMWLEEGNLTAAQHWARHFQSRPPDHEGERLVGSLCLARVLASHRSYAEATDVLSGVLDETASRGITGWRIRALALAATLQHRSGHDRAAQESLIEALTLAEPEGYVRTFVDEGPVMKHLLTEALAHPEGRTAPSAAYLARLVAATEAVSGRAHEGLSEPLTEREAEVLRLMAAGLSNQQIADALFLAVGTVKKHSHLLYQKLGVSSRTQAVHRGRALHLL